MSNILIIGGSGCVGQETTRWLLQRGDHKIVCLSRGQTAVIQKDGVFYEQGDIMNLESLVRVMKLHEISHVMHAAGLRTTECKQNTLKAVEVNVMGTSNVFEAARQVGGIERVVFTSTAAVYQVPEDGTFVDEGSATVPLNSYTATKLAAENIAQFYANEYELPTVALRPQIIFGPDRDAGSTAGVSHAIKCAQQKQAYHIGFRGCYGFHYSADVGKCHGMALTQKASNSYEVYNLPCEILDVEDLCQRLNTMAGVELITCDGPEYPFARGLLANKFQRDFGSFHITSFQEVIQRSF